jgi:ectoine hydroxylase-related dioxygenase (phytanoyl-CoA dioxygenase family)
MSILDTGYQIISQICDITTLKSECDLLYQQDVINKQILYTDGSERVRGLLRSNQVIKLIEDSQILPLTQQLINAPVILGGTQLNVVKPNSKGMGYHRDYPYFCIDSGLETKHSQILTVQVIVALTDFTLDNGCTTFIPNSFNLNKLTTEDCHSFKPLLLKAGDAIIMRGDIWHAVNSNQTSNDRISLLLNFHPYWVKTMTSNLMIAGAGVQIDKLSVTMQNLLGANFKNNFFNDYNKNVHQ